MTRFLIVLFLVFGMTETVMALRCGHKLVSEGDYIEQVRHRCGDPMAIDTYTIIREQRIHYPRHYYLSNKAFPYYAHKSDYGVVRRSGQIEIFVEEWVYNFGPRKLMRRLRFENGILRDIDELDHGYIPKRR